MNRVIATTAVAAGLAFGLAAPASAQEVPCGTPAVAAVYKTVVTPATSSEKVIHHTAVTHVVHHAAVTHDEVVVDAKEIWANWSPNHTHGPQDYVPVWPYDARGTWHIHDKIPGGHVGPDGVYQRDKGEHGNSDWFYRQAERSHVETVVDVAAYDETVVDKEAYDETVTVNIPATSKSVLVSAATPAGKPCTVKTTVKSTVKHNTLARSTTTVVDSQEVAPKLAAPKELAMTGSDNAPLGIAGASMLFLGGLAYALRRRLSRS